MSETKWKLVPMDPTEEMLKAGVEQYYSDTYDSYPFAKRASECYRAMLAASPLPSSEPNTGGWPSETVIELRDRAKSYRLGGPSSEHTAALLDKAAWTIEDLQVDIQNITASRDGYRKDAERMRDAVEFAHSEGFEWPSDPLPAPEPQPEPCTVCNGDGSLEIPDPQRDDPYYARVDRCENCNGCGWLSANHSTTV